MDIEEFILTEQKYLSHLTPKVKEEEERKMTFWRIHDSADCDVKIDENSIHSWIEKTSALPIPKVNELPRDYSFKGYQEYCMKHGLRPLDIQEEIDEYFRLTRFFKRWILYYNYAPFSYLLILFTFIFFLGL
jgi:hypothetical protein